MTPLIYACISLLPALFIAPVYPQHIPTNETTGQHELNRFQSRAPAPGPAHVLCSGAAKLTRDPHDMWKTCMIVFYRIFKSENRDFLSDLLWAPKEWHGTVLADKQCPQQFHQDGCHIVIDCAFPTPISYTSIFVLLSRVISLCIRDEGHKGGIAFIVDRPRFRSWWMTVSGHDLKYSEAHSSKLRIATETRQREATPVDLEVLTPAEQNFIAQVSRTAPSRRPGETIIADLPRGWEHFQ